MKMLKDFTIVGVDYPSQITPEDCHIYIWKKGYEGAHHWKCYLYDTYVTAEEMTPVIGIGDSRQGCLDSALDWYEIEFNETKLDQDLNNGN